LYSSALKAVAYNEDDLLIQDLIDLVSLETRQLPSRWTSGGH
jgi:hypothetical protein